MTAEELTEELNIFLTFIHTKDLDTMSKKEIIGNYLTESKINELNLLILYKQRLLLISFFKYFVQKGEMECDEATTKYYVDAFIADVILKEKVSSG